MPHEDTKEFLAKLEDWLTNGANARPTSGVLYHYTNSAAFINILREHTLWASHVRHLNDSTEFVHGITLMKAALTELCGELGISDEDQHLRKAFSRHFVESLEHPDEQEKKVGSYVVSFSEEGDDLGQWQHYAGRQGVCLGFRAEALVELAGQRDPSPSATGNWRLSRCDYDPSSQQQKLRDIALELIRIFRPRIAALAASPDLEVRPIIASSVNIGIYSALAAIAPALKDKAFARESEWRLISPTSAPLNGVDYRTGARSIIPFRRFRFPKLGQWESRMPLVSVRLAPGTSGAANTFAIKSMLQSFGLGSGRLPVLPSNVPLNW